MGVLEATGRIVREFEQANPPASVNRRTGLLASRRPPEVRRPAGSYGKASRSTASVVRRSTSAALAPPM